MPKLPDHFAIIDEQRPDRPFRLVAAPARNFLNTSFTETPGSRSARGPADRAGPSRRCGAAGLVEAAGAAGQRARQVVVHARLFDGVQPGVVIVESVWPNDDFEGGIGINVLTSDDPAPPFGGAVFHDTAVWMEAVAAEGVLREAAD